LDRNADEVTSIDPGNEPGGVFWTVPIPRESVDVNPGKGTATYQVSNLVTRDFHDFVNDSLLHGPSTPTTLSFKIEWGGPITDRQNVKDTANGFAGEFVLNSATMEWTADEPNRPAVWGGPARYVSDPASTSHSVFAMVGHERNGVFFSG
jgi:hypothetical protein